MERWCESKTGALLINFPDNGPQNGLFCSTVSFLLFSDNTFPCPWAVLTDFGKPVCLKRNVISFTVGDFPGEVTLIEEWTHFEVHVKTDSECEKTLWHLVYRAVFHGLEIAAKTHHHSDSDNVPQPAIVCPKHCNYHNIPTPSTLHPATIDNKGKWVCTQSSRYFGQVTTGIIPWLHTLQFEPTTTQLKPLFTATCTS